MRVSMKEFWNERYGQHEFIYGQKPNSFFEEQIALLQPGKILLPAEGEGRNAVYAATQGWEVTAFDFSEAGKKKAEKLASETGVTIDYQISAAADFEAEADTFDVVAFIYAHFPSQLRQAVHQKAVKWLKPGGKVILEAFHARQLHRNSGGPKKPEMLYDLPMLRNDFSPLQEVLLEEKIITLSEGAYHKGVAEVVRFVGEKKG